MTDSPSKRARRIKDVTAAERCFSAALLRIRRGAGNQGRDRGTRYPRPAILSDDRRSGLDRRMPGERAGLGPRLRLFVPRARRRAVRAAACAADDARPASGSARDRPRPPPLVPPPAGGRLAPRHLARRRHLRDRSRRIPDRRRGRVSAVPGAMDVVGGWASSRTLGRQQLRDDLHPRAALPRSLHRSLRGGSPCRCAAAAPPRAGPDSADPARPRVPAPADPNRGDAQPAIDRGDPARRGRLAERSPR